MTKSLLIIDDDLDVKESMKAMLDLKDIHSTLACEGSEGINQVQKNQFDAVLLDIKMPNMDGYETFEKIIQIEPNAKVFFVTGFSTDEEKLQHSIKLGLKGIFFKPVKISSILEKINSS